VCVMKPFAEHYKLKQQHARDLGAARNGPRAVAVTITLGTGLRPVPLSLALRCHPSTCASDSVTT